MNLPSTVKARKRLVKLPDSLNQIANRIDREGGVPVLVGGAVRDYLLGMESKDLDVEVFNLHYNQLVSILKKHGRVSAVGKAFGVLKLSLEGYHFDFSLPRNDLKTGIGHRGFRITTNPEMSFKAAASRRDFTINALGYNLITKEILDEFDGRNDLSKRRLRVVAPETFVEDPLRVLRGIQFAARFKLSVPQTTKEVFKSVVNDLDELPKERIFEEISKLLLKSRNPSYGFIIADEVGVVKKLFPELNALKNVIHEPDWYPQRDSWAHTLNIVDEAARLRKENKFENLSLMLASLCHEFSKLNTAEFVNLDWEHVNGSTSPNIIARCFLQRMTNEIKLVENVDALLNGHQTMKKLFESTQVKNGDIRRLSLKVDIPLLVRLAEADHNARFKEREKPENFLAGEWLISRFHALKLENSQNLQPILKGRHLISMGLKPGPFFGKILDNAYQKQLDDELITLEEALSWAQDQIEASSDDRNKQPVS